MSKSSAEFMNILGNTLQELAGATDISAVINFIKSMPLLIDKTESKYPVEKAKGVSTKYNKL